MSYYIYNCLSYIFTVFSMKKEKELQVQINSQCSIMFFFYIFIVFIILMGQCSLTDPQGEYGDIFSTSKGSDQGNLFEKQSCIEKDRILWGHELGINIVSNTKLSEELFFDQKITKTHPCFIQISKDVTRTFPELPYFGNKKNIQKFQRVLKKLAIYFPHVGYTQGLNFIVGFLIMSGWQEKESFNLLVKMLTHDKILAIGLYQDEFPLVTFYCQVFWNLLEKKIPALYKVLKKSYITDDLWLFQWFISLFLYNFPVEFVKKVWDYVISKKEMAVVLIALGIIKSLKKEILNVNFEDEIDFLEFVSQFKSLQFIRKYLNLKKIFDFANSVSRSDISHAISQTKCFKNPYRKYFSATSQSQRQQYQILMETLMTQRINFASSKDEDKKFQKIQVFQNVKLILTKHKLCQSEIKRSSINNRKSNVSSPFSIHTVKSNCMNIQDFQRRNNF